jgi:pre-mRNA cleavage complex 2 protein Pcf11
VSKTAFGQNIHDASIRSKLSALLALQELLRTQNLPPSELMRVKSQIDALSVNMTGHKTLDATPPIPQPPYQPPLPLQTIAQPIAAPIPPPASAPPTLSIDALLGKGALAALLSRGSTKSQAGAVQPPPPVAIRSPPIQQATTVPPPRPGAPTTPNPLALLAQLRQSGLVPAVGQAPSASSMLAPTPVSMTSLAGVISSANRPRVPLEEIRSDIQLKTSSLKQYVDPGTHWPLRFIADALLPRFRPHLLPLLYDDLGPPCTQCGRRFKTDDEGKSRKTAHMDWHFRVHQRIVEAEKRGQHRSWYVDAADWVKSRDVVDVDDVSAAADDVLGAKNDNSKEEQAEKKPQWMPVPSGAGADDAVCPICQERFEMKWLDEAQEWVWMDAVSIGGRAYHASCHREATKEVELGYGGGARFGTPEGSVLGKRKADVSPVY